MIGASLLLLLMGCARVASALSSTVYTISKGIQKGEHPGKPVGAALTYVKNQQTRHKVTSQQSMISKLLKLKKYPFKVNGTEYVLYPLDRIMQGSRCLGRFERIAVRKDKIVLTHTNGDVCAGISNYSTVVDVHPAKEFLAFKSLLTESGSFKFRLELPELMDEIQEKEVDVLLPPAKQEDSETEEMDSEAAPTQETDNEKTILIELSPDSGFFRDLVKRSKQLTSDMRAKKENAGAEDEAAKKRQEEHSSVGSDENEENGGEEAQQSRPEL